MKSLVPTPLVLVHSFFLFFLLLGSSSITGASAGKIKITRDDDGSEIDADFNQASTFNAFTPGITYTLVSDANINAFVTATGAAGAGYQAGQGKGFGGLGGTTQGNFTFVKDQVYKLLVGGGGGRDGIRRFGGFPGGGDGDENAGGGGGFTGLFKESVTHANSILIAGGGGGCGNDYFEGAVGGGLTGGNARSHAHVEGSKGGTQTAGGDCGLTCYLPTQRGSELQGGSWFSGGGGGYYGGAGGDRSMEYRAGGGGGSGYIHPLLISGGSTVSGAGPAPLKNWPSGAFTIDLISISEDSGNAGGDPHFTTFDGTHFSFHGQCDLVLMKSASFSSGKGLDLHIRTTLVEKFNNLMYSYISGAALRIGDDVMEISIDGSLVVNGGREIMSESAGDEKLNLPIAFAGAYLLTKTLNGTYNRIIIYEVDLGNKRYIKIRVNTSTKMIFVQVEGSINDSVGLLGTPGVKGLYTRDGETDLTSSWNSFGLEWQVNNSDRKLFVNKHRFPQHPQSCSFEVLNKNGESHKKNIRRRILDESPALVEINVDDAISACADSPDGFKKEFCIQDVMATGLVELANDPFYLF